jgi:putrescine aminotransferase
MTLGKALGGGVFPISALHGNERAWHRLDENPWWLTNTFGGSAPACACALATIEILERDGVIDAVPGKGEFFLDLLREAVSNHPSLIKEVRGLGLFIGIEFNVVETGVKVAKELFTKDVLVAHTINNPAVIRIEPPLTITEDEMRQVTARFAACLEECAG